MVEGGLFITLYDKETLKLYLDRGIYGQLMSTEEGEPSVYSSVYYKTMADYGCCRKGNHVFFFLKREIYYGGQIKGSKKYGSFYLNGQNGPMGRKADAPLVWDESTRNRYESLNQEGVFKVDDNERCQHFLIQFEDKLGLAGKGITSDQLYFKLGEYPYPLPSNSISGRAFCTLTPGETKILIDLFGNESTKYIEPKTKEDIKLTGDLVPFKPKFGIKTPLEASTESHLEASLASNPELLPEVLRPKGSAICRQVPISPFKPKDIDLVDICYFKEKKIKGGTIPNIVIELKNKKPSKKDLEQVKRYIKWLDKLEKVYNVDTNNIDFWLYAPAFTRNTDKNLGNYRKRVNVVEFSNQLQKKL